MGNSRHGIRPCVRCGRRATERFCARCRRVKHPEWPIRGTENNGICARCGQRRRLTENKCNKCRWALGQGRVRLGSEEDRARRSRRSKGANNPAWKGGRRPDRDGYVWLRVTDDDPLAVAMANKRRYVQEHRLVMAHSIGRPLDRREAVHHINGVTGDNRLENLKLFSSHSDHLRHYHLEVCPHCGGALR